MKVKVRIRHDELAVKLTESYFDYDPYNGMFESEMVEMIEDNLKTIDGCRFTIEELNNLFCELLEDHKRLIGEYSELKRRAEA